MKHQICIILVLFVIALSVCGCVKEDGVVTDDPIIDAPDEKPDPVLICLDNRAGWEKVYCFIFTDEGTDHMKSMMERDNYGIYCIEIPSDCFGFAFSNGEGEQTDVFSIPDLPERTYDNLTDQWTLYEDVIANSLTLGENLIRITTAHKTKGGEYILFHAENNGLYTFTSDTPIDIKIVSTELSAGSWENGSVCWTTFFSSGNTAELTAGYYYVYIDNSDPSVFAGLHYVQVEYREIEIVGYPLLNCIFSDGKITVVFLENNGYFMKIIDSVGNTFVYYYTAYESDEGYILNLQVIEGGEEYNVNDYLLSELSAMGRAFIYRGDLYFNDMKISSLAS